MQPTGDEARIQRLAELNDRLIAQGAELRAALRDVRAAILNENGLNSGAVADTLWVSPIETAVDRIDAALGAPVAASVPEARPLVWSSVAHARSGCPKCAGEGFYLYDADHRKPCELCCPHDQGRFLLKEGHGARDGMWCCRAGCGDVRETEHG